MDSVALEIDLAVIGVGEWDSVSLYATKFLSVSMNSAADKVEGSVSMYASAHHSSIAETVCMTLRPGRLSRFIKVSSIAAFFAGHVPSLMRPFRFTFLKPSSR